MSFDGLGVSAGAAFYREVDSVRGKGMEMLRALASLPLVSTKFGGRKFGWRQQ